MTADKVLLFQLLLNIVKLAVEGLFLVDGNNIYDSFVAFKVDYVTQRHAYGFRCLLEGKAYLV